MESPGKSSRGRVRVMPLWRPAPTPGRWSIPGSNDCAEAIYRAKNRPAPGPRSSGAPQGVARRMGKPAGRRPSVAKKKALLTKPPFSVRTFGGTALWAFKSGPSEMLFPWPQAPHHRGLFLFPRSLARRPIVLAVKAGSCLDTLRPNVRT